MLKCSGSQCCEFQVQGKGSWPAAYLRPFPPKLPSHPGCLVTWSRVPLWFTVGNIYRFFFLGKTYFEFPQGTQPLCKGLESQRKSSSLVQVVTGLQLPPGWRRRLHSYICTAESGSSSREFVAALLWEAHPWWWVCGTSGVSLPVACAPTLNSSSLNFLCFRSF